MSKWSYTAVWRVHKTVKRKDFISKRDAAIFVRNLIKHGIKPQLFKHRKVTWLDRILAFFGRGQITRGKALIR